MESTAGVASDACRRGVWRNRQHAEKPVFEGGGHDWRQGCLGFRERGLGFQRFQVGDVKTAGEAALARGKRGGHEVLPNLLRIEVG